MPLDGAQLGKTTDHSAKKSFVRRRKWFRVRKSTPANEAAAVEEGVPPDEGPTS